MPLSEYVDSLDGMAKSRYFDKLKALGLAATDDPYVWGDFQNAMQLWPPVEDSHTHPAMYSGQLLHLCPSLLLPRDGAHYLGCCWGQSPGLSG